MTKHSVRTGKQVGTLKAALLTGSVIATMAGTYLLGLQEPMETATTVSQNESITVIIPADEARSIQQLPNNQRTQIQLRPIPQAVQPRINPVARTRSSR